MTIQTLISNTDSKKFIGESQALQTCLSNASRLKGTSANILIEAETGTGKELLARFIHDLEGDNNRPFIVVNCATLPDNLIESELFGHEKGSFTGAIAKHTGKFLLADGGDIFLDEINSLKIDLQAKLLRVIQEKMVWPVGSTKPIKINCRVMAATNQDLRALCANKQFREDLFHRLHVIKLHMPPLRERIEDVPLLVEYFIRKYDPSNTKKVSDAVMQNLINYDWPGNVRELENQIHSLVVLGPTDVIEEGDLPEHIINPKQPSLMPTTLKVKVSQDLIKGKKDVLNLSIDDYTKLMRVQYVKLFIEKHSGCVKTAAKAMGISRSNVYKLLNDVQMIKLHAEG
ncbi:MAG: sigma 54-interacting transcriptional regulator [Deltaproteobacteria bacterium]|nr:sigma 54-interacting transcriptional regulator [Deltaproteobacteria bacterium]